MIGLTEEEVLESRKKYGSNEIMKPSEIRLLHSYLHV